MTLPIQSIVLVDCPDDGIDERGWVSTDVPRRKARAILEPALMDGELLRLGEPSRVWLLPPEEDDQNWEPCAEGDAGAREFWQFVVEDREPLLRYWWDRLTWCWRARRAIRYLNRNETRHD